MRPVAAALAALALAAALVAAPVAAAEAREAGSWTRALLARPIASPRDSASSSSSVPAAATACNTTRGRSIVADDRGVVCSRDDLDPSTGCCRSGEPHSCSTCAAGDGCCESYARCVSCCLSPGRAAEVSERLATTPRGRGQPQTGLWASPWEFCTGVCRTNARSTVHENAYLLPRKHCYSRTGMPRELPDRDPSSAWIAQGDGEAVAAMDGDAGQGRDDARTSTYASAGAGNGTAASTGVRAARLAGREGASCDATCASRGLSCEPTLFDALAPCDVLRAVFECQAGCGPAPAGIGGAFPGHVSEHADKKAWPAACWTLEGAIVAQGEGGGSESVLGGAARRVQGEGAHSGGTDGIFMDARGVSRGPELAGAAGSPRRLLLQASGADPSMAATKAKARPAQPTCDAASSGISRVCPCVAHPEDGAAGVAALEAAARAAENGARFGRALLGRGRDALAGGEGWAPGVVWVDGTTTA